MDVKTEYRFDAKPDDVFAMFSDPDYQRRKLADAGHQHVDCLESGPGDGDVAQRIVNRWNVAVDVPGPLKRVLSPTNTVTQTDEWRDAEDGARSGTFTVDIKGVPIRISGTMRLVAEGSGSVETIEATLKASLPLIGGKLEKLAQENFLKSTTHEQEFANRWLAGQVS